MQKAIKGLHPITSPKDAGLTNQKISVENPLIKSVIAINHAEAVPESTGDFISSTPKSGVKTRATVMARVLIGSGGAEHNVQEPTLSPVPVECEASCLSITKQTKLDEPAIISTTCVLSTHDQTDTAAQQSPAARAANTGELETRAAHPMVAAAASPSTGPLDMSCENTSSTLAAPETLAHGPCLEKKGYKNEFMKAIQRGLAKQNEMQTTQMLKTGKNKMKSRPLVPSRIQPRVNADVDHVMAVLDELRRTPVSLE
jgi:hypothetical protein